MAAMHMWAEHGFFGGHVFLDFVNTIDDAGKSRSSSSIPDWETVMAWAVASGVVDGPESKILARHAGTAAAGAEVGRLHAWRERAWCALSRVAAHRRVDPDELRELSSGIRWAIGHASLRQRGPSFAWTVPPTEGVVVVRARLAVALADLLAGQDLNRLRECGRCTGLFLDHGRGVGRRWCRMKTCGNRAKSERFRAR